ncbi:MAG TPA: ABC transporter substrate-binding protein [Vicinamibacteria bacterium]|nr:ABC transporter substrate-binding protein [Vicinamibacteria bacterium]
MACTPEPTPLLRVGTNLWPGYELLFLARDLGYLDDSIRLVEYASASQALRAYRSGMIEAACLTLDELVLLESQSGTGARLVSVFDVSQGADALLAVPALDRLADLKGRRLGVEDTALGAFVLARVLERAGLTRADIDLVPLEVNEHERAFVEGRLDAVITFEPVRTKLLARGARVLFDSTQMPGEIVDVLVVGTEPLSRQTSQVRTILRGHFRALEYLRAQPEDAARRLARRQGVTAAEMLESLRGLQFPDLKDNLALVDGPSATLLTSGQALASVMSERRLLPRPVEVAALIDASPLRELAR